MDAFAVHFTVEESALEDVTVLKYVARAAIRRIVLVPTLADGAFGPDA